jgi:hypothetical protein
MAQPTHSEVQAVDPVLTNMLVGYSQSDDRFVASKAFPVVPVEKQGFTYYTFGKKYFFADDLKPRAPGSQFARGGYGVSTASGLAQLWGLEHAIADEARANNQMPMALEQAGALWLSNQSLIRKERAFSADFMVTGVWGTDDNNSATDWDSTGVPTDDILTAQRTIGNNTGQKADTLVVGFITWQGLLGNTNIADRIRYVARADIQTIEQSLLSILGIRQLLVSKASYNSANEGQTASLGAVIDDDALLIASTPTPGIMIPSAGYTFAWGGGGGTGSIAQYREHQSKSDVMQLSEAWDQKVVATDCGYFWADIV